jgi:hypothetical protein
VIKFILLKSICAFKGHNLVGAGTCPYTGSAYDLCTRCELMIPQQVAV